MKAEWEFPSVDEEILAKIIDDLDKLMMGDTWDYTVLEIYEPHDGWPAEGDPAE